ncbi:hypothetical protein GCM10027063_20030 [Promicromonospora xylanilytica]
MERSPNGSDEWQHAEPPQLSQLSFIVRTTRGNRAAARVAYGRVTTLQEAT